MSLIRLKNVSKYYYSKGVIASGFSKINLELNNGEFVAITGESGSGKSTLLNVISGLDSYEEGEMFINEQETSHYTEKNYEDYRRKYVGNIFQSFNLINSYTVYQNIELVLLLNGNKKHKIKTQINELIRKVGLYKFRNTKVSKLSGGQKQRVAIARALAKETPIIIADEPTGNLDSKSAEEVLKLLSDISKNKLVIVVTHNYDQIQKYVTRKITMHDGKITEDEILKDSETINVVKELDYNNITFLNRLCLGIRNVFNIKVKFLLLLFIYLFISFALCFEYSSSKDDEYIMKSSGTNSFFLNSDNDRIIIYKKNKSIFNDDDYMKISKVKNVKTITKNDVLIDSYVTFSDDKLEIYLYGNIKNIKDFKGKLDYGKMPENPNEIVVLTTKYDYYLNEKHDDVIGKTIYANNSYFPDKTTKYKIVGIKVSQDAILENNEFYIDDDSSINLNKSLVYETSDKKIKFNESYLKIENYSLDKIIVNSSKVKDGTAVIASNLNSNCKNENCKNKKILINVKNHYYDETLKVKVANTFNKKSLKKLTGYKDYDMLSNAIFISNNDYNKLFNKGIYQTSVFVNDVFKLDETVNELHNLGYKTFALSDHLYVEEPLEYLQIIRLVVTIILVVILFFITYFVTRIILKSRKMYFETIRTLGSTKKVCKNILSIELITVANISYLIFTGVLVFAKLKILKYNIFQMIIRYFHIKEVIFLYIIVILMSYLISLKYAKRIFKNTIISSFKEDE